jgi:hypothetical protein
VNYIKLTERADFRFDASKVLQILFSEIYLIVISNVIISLIVNWSSRIWF